MSKKEPFLDNKTFEALATFQSIWQKQLNDLAKSITKFLSDTAPALEGMSRLFKQLSELYVQYKTAYAEGIKNFEDPEQYDPTKVAINPWTERLALRAGLEFMDDLQFSRFSFMYERFRKAFEGYLDGEYQLAAFIFISMIDGMLHKFYDEHKGLECLTNHGKRPPFGACLKHLQQHYKLDIFIGSAEFESRLSSFFKHRNEIMHGGKFSYFDKNICTIALLFLTVTYASITSRDKSEVD